MALTKNYAPVVSRRGEIMKKTLGIDFSTFESGSIAFDYEKMVSSMRFSMEKVERIQGLTRVGSTPLFTLRNLTVLACRCVKPGYGATICVKDKMASPSGSFRARRATYAVAFARAHGYKDVITATSGNYGAAVASQATMQDLRYIIVQEAHGSREVGQPEIIEKAQACEAVGAEAVQVTMGPGLFYESLSLLEDTGFFNASLYSPFSIAGIETLGHETALQYRAQFGGDLNMVVYTNAGGGVITGTARDLRKTWADHTQIATASIDLTGLHMAFDTQFSRKPCTAGHTGFGVPFANWSDRSDVSRSAARPLRYMDHYVIVTQGEIMCITELLVNLEDLERGPTGNTSLAAAFYLAQELLEDQILVVSKAEYTGAGKHMQPQLDFARENGIEVRFGKPGEEVPGVSAILPADPYRFRVGDLDLDKMRHSPIKMALKACTAAPTEADYEFLAQETNKNLDWVREQVTTIVPTF